MNRIRTMSFLKKALAVAAIILIPASLSGQIIRPVEEPVEKTTQSASSGPALLRPAKSPKTPPIIKKLSRTPQTESAQKPITATTPPIVRKRSNVQNILNAPLNSQPSSVGRAVVTSTTPIEQAKQAQSIPAAANPSTNKAASFVGSLKSSPAPHPAVARPFQSNTPTLAQPARVELPQPERMPLPTRTAMLPDVIRNRNDAPLTRQPIDMIPTRSTSLLPAAPAELTPSGSSQNRSNTPLAIGQTAPSQTPYALPPRTASLQNVFPTRQDQPRTTLPNNTTSPAIQKSSAGYTRNLPGENIVLPPKTNNRQLFPPTKQDVAPAPLADPSSNGGLQPVLPLTDPMPSDGFIDNATTSSPIMTDSVVGGCNICGDMNCSGCQGSLTGQAFGTDTIAGQFGCCGSVSCARRYLHAEALYYMFDDSAIAGANAGGLGDLDGEFGWRITAGRRFDATAGDEISYWGTPGWEESRRIIDPGFRLAANFLVGPPFLPAQFSSFFNAAEQIESREADLHSFEYNRVKWGWDVIKTHWGIRGIYFNDEYNLFSNNGFSTGNLRLEAANFMIGPQIGGELFYDVGYRWSYSFVGKGGAYLNFTSLETEINDGGTNILNRDDNDANLSGSLDLGAFAHYQLSPNARFRVGYNLHWLFGTATVAENFPRVINANTGGSVLDEDEVLFHGVSFGFEIFR